MCRLICLLPALILPFTATAERPNFLILFIDDMGYGDPSCYGNTEVRTPHIDQLAKEGMRFTSFYAQPVCGPSRAALMTGRYPQRTGGGWHTRSEEVFLSEILKAQGYRTACIGKWDMSERRYQKDLVPNAQGFDHYFGPLGANDANKVTLYENHKQLETSNDMAGLSRLYTDKSIEFLEKQKQGEPFFLYLAHTMMHVVIDASPEFRDRTGKGIYADTLVELDHEIGRLLAKLEQLGLAENTVVLFTSDNGPWSNNHEFEAAKNAKYVEWTKGPKTPWGNSGPLRGAKGSTWEGGVRVPGIVRWPGKVEAGSTSDAIVSTLDVLPTFSALAGAADEVPTDRIIDGVDQSALWLGKSAKGARDHFLYYHQGELQAVRKGPWKLRMPRISRMYTRWPEFDRGTRDTELYHLGDDLAESTNLAGQKPEVIKELMEFADDLTAPRYVGDWQPLYKGTLDDFRIYFRGQGYIGDVDAQDVFVAEKDQIHVRKGTNGLIATKQPYSHYHVKVDYRWGAKGGSMNAGLMTHIDLNSKCVKDNRPRSVEINMKADAPGSLWMASNLGPFGSTFVEEGTDRYLPRNEGGVPRVANPFGKRTVLARYPGKQPNSRPHNEWNTLEAIVRGDESVVILHNGERVNELTELKQANPKGKRATRTPQTSGGIGLQSEGQEIFYRNFLIRKLKP